MVCRTATETREEAICVICMNNIDLTVNVNIAQSLLIYHIDYLSEE